MTKRPDSSLEITILKGIIHLVDVVVDDSVVNEVSVTEAEEIEVTEAVEIGGASYLATTVVRKDISLAIAGPKEVVLMVR